MDSGLWLLLVAVLATVALPVWVYLAFCRNVGQLPVREQIESQGILPEEWRFTYHHHCLPLRCPRLQGDPPACPRSIECEVCTALFMEHYWQHIAAPRKERRHLPIGWRVGVALLLVGSGALLLACSRMAAAGYTLVAGAVALLMVGPVVRTYRAVGRRLTPHPSDERSRLSPPFAAG